MSLTPATDPALVADLRQLIDGARQRAAAAVNAELTLLYWQGAGENLRTVETIELAPSWTGGMKR